MESCCFPFSKSTYGLIPRWSCSNPNKLKTIRCPTMSDAYGIPGLGLSPVKDRTEQGSLDQETENEAEKSRRLQERHYFLLKELQKMAAEVPG